MARPRPYVAPFLRSLGLFALALFLPILVLIVIAAVFVGRNLARNTWPFIWLGIAAGSGTLVIAGAFQLRRAWLATRDHPRRKRIVAQLVAIGVLALAAFVAFILANIRSTCEPC
jgi:hypothetical protein